jgi:hypothetical protein
MKKINFKFKNNEVKEDLIENIILLEEYKNELKNNLILNILLNKKFIGLFELSTNSIYKIKFLHDENLKPILQIISIKNFKTKNLYILSDGEYYIKCFISSFLNSFKINNLKIEDLNLNSIIKIKEYIIQNTSIYEKIIIITNFKLINNNFNFIIGNPKNFLKRKLEF